MEKYVTKEGKEALLPQEAQEAMRDQATAYRILGGEHIPSEHITPDIIGKARKGEFLPLVKAVSRHRRG